MDLKGMGKPTLKVQSRDPNQLLTYQPCLFILGHNTRPARTKSQWKVFENRRQCRLQCEAPHPRGVPDHRRPHPSNDGPDRSCWVSSSVLAPESACGPT